MNIMSNTQVTPHPDEAEYYGHKIIETYTVETIERSNESHSIKHDETFYDETTTDSEEIRVTFPAVKAVSQDTGDELSKDELQTRIQEYGGAETERVDFDEAHVTVGNETFTVTYDTSDAPEV